MKKWDFFGSSKAWGVSWRTVRGCVSKESTKWFPYGQFLGFLLFRICINGPLKEAQLLKTADDEKGGGEHQASSK